MDAAFTAVRNVALYRPLEESSASVRCGGECDWLHNVARRQLYDTTPVLRAEVA